MEVQCGAWRLEECDQASTTDASRDQDISVNDSPPARKSQRSTEEEWQEILEQVNSHSNLANDLSIPSPPPPIMTSIHSPRQSIETSTAMDLERHLSASSSNSSLFPYTPQDNQPYDVWCATGAPTPTFPPAIPEHEMWSAPQSFHCGPFQYMGAISTRTPMLEHPSYLLHEAHHVMAGQSPMLSQGSPHGSEYIDEDWDQQDLQQPWIDGSGSDEINDMDPADPCYAQLLYRCLREAPDNIMSLRDLYDWVKEHSQKAKDPKNRGWQNSVRHNLSMNAAFERVPPRESQGIKKGSMWRLTQAALRDGVISTTRYRKDPKHKPLKRSTPALKRQLSGAKGGQATRNAQRRAQALREARSHPNLASRYRQTLRHPQQFGPALYNPPMPFYANGPGPHHFGPLPHTPTSPYFVEVEGTASPMPRSAPLTPPQGHGMYDMQPKSAPPDMPFSHVDFTNGGLIGAHHDFAPDTPSLGTEASFMSEEGMQSLMSHNASREATAFAVEA